MKRALLAIALAGCGGSTDPEPVASLPAAICRVPEATTGPWFSEVTAEIGLGKTPELEPLSTGIVAGDLDGEVEVAILRGGEARTVRAEPSRRGAP